MPLKHGPRAVRLKWSAIFEKLGISNNPLAQNELFGSVRDAFVGPEDPIDFLKDLLEELCEEHDSMFAATEANPNLALAMITGLAFDTFAGDPTLLPLSLLHVAREPAAPEGWLPNCIITVFKEGAPRYVYRGDYRLADFIDPDLGPGVGVVAGGDWVDPATLRYERLVQELAGAAAAVFNPGEHCVLWTPHEAIRNYWAPAFPTPSPDERRLTAENFVNVLEEGMDAFYLKDEQGRFLPEISFVIRALSLDERLDHNLAS